MPKLSKSRFCSGLQCLKRLYWQCFPPDDFQDDKNGEFNVILEQGREIGELARQAFPKGVLVDEDHKHLADAVAHTQTLLTDQNIPAIFEATFAFKDVLVRVDILERLPRNRWRLIEVKQSSKVKDEHIPDVAIQMYVLEQSGISLRGAALMHVNTEYVYDGKKLRLDNLFTFVDVLADARELQAQVPLRLKEMRAALARSSPPDVDAGDHCVTPYQCEFFSLCNKEVAFDHVSNLPNISAKKIMALQDDGIESILEIPDDFDLTERQSIACKCVKTRKPHFGPELALTFSELRHPLFFMDFETSNPAIPRYAGMRPYEMVPFQWSVHIQSAPGGKVEHFEFLAGGVGDPREEFVESLLAVLERHALSGHIIVYNQTFESCRLTDLARWLPAYASRVRKVQRRLFDLLPIVRGNVYHHSFCGSFSLKSVLPALTPTTYDGLEIGAGDQATAAYEQMVRGLFSPRETARARKALLAYCAQDTLAMVKLLERLRLG